MTPEFKPMADFDPTMRVMVREKTSGECIPWEPEWAGKYEAQAKEHSPGVIEYDGYLLDGWAEIPELAGKDKQAEAETEPEAAS